MRRPLSGDRRITGDTATHAADGVGPATDYGADEGEIVYAPFSGTAQHYDSGTGGNSVRLSAPGLVFVGQHFRDQAIDGWVNEGDPLAVVGNTGSASEGAHLHCWIEVNGRRMAFEEYLASLGWATSPAGGRVTAQFPPTPTEGESMSKLWRYISATPNVFVEVDHLNMTYRVIPAGSLEAAGYDNDVKAGTRRYDLVADPEWGQVFGNGQFRAITKPAPATATVTANLAITAAQLKSLVDQIVAAVVAKLPKKITGTLS